MMRKFNDPHNFSYETTSNMDVSIFNLFSRVLRAIQINLTHEELQGLITPPDEFEFLVKASKVVQPSQLYTPSFELSWPDRHYQEQRLLVYVPQPYSILISRNVAFQRNFNPELTDRINTWIEHRKEIGLEFGRAIAVMRYLCQNYSKQEIRYIFPNILVLMKMHPEERSKVALLEHAKVRSVLISFQLRQSIEKVSATIAGALLVQELEALIPTLELKPSRTRAEEMLVDDSFTYFEVL